MRLYFVFHFGLEKKESYHKSSIAHIELKVFSAHLYIYIYIYIYIYRERERENKALPEESYSKNMWWCGVLIFC